MGSRRRTEEQVAGPWLPLCSPTCRWGGTEAREGNAVVSWTSCVQGIQYKHVKVCAHLHLVYKHRMYWRTVILHRVQCWYNLCRWPADRLTILANNGNIDINTNFYLNMWIYQDMHFSTRSVSIKSIVGHCVQRWYNLCRWPADRLTILANNGNINININIYLNMWLSGHAF